MARDHSNQEVLPNNSAVTMATRQMTKAFREPGIQNIALVVLTDTAGSVTPMKTSTALWWTSCAATNETSS